MAEYGGTAFRVKAACGSPLLVGVLCAPGAVQSARDSLMRLQQLSLRPHRDPVALDMVLANAVRACCGNEVWAVGVSAQVQTMPHRCGGVLGSPHMESKSSQNQLESICNGLCLYSSPGGPGAVFSAPGETERSILADVTGDRAIPIETAYRIETRLIEQSITTHLILTDGSGPGAEGLLILRAGGQHIRFIMKSDR